MGCDIHIHTERIQVDYSTKTEKWINCDHYKLNPYYDESNPEEMEADGEQKWELLEIYSGRDYTLFSILAGVRDYNGIYEPISEPRGIPEDASDIVKKDKEDWGSDGHSHSYLTLKELKEYRDANTQKKFSGYFNERLLRQFEDGGTPEQWYVVEQGSATEYREWVDRVSTLDPLIEALEVRKKEEWPYYERDEKGTDYDSQIRIVFWFDN